MRNAMESVPRDGQFVDVEEEDGQEPPASSLAGVPERPFSISFLSVGVFSLAVSGILMAIVFRADVADHARSLVGYPEKLNSPSTAATSRVVRHEGGTSADKEAERAVAMARELAAAQRQVEARAAQAGLADSEVALLRKAIETAAAEHQRAVEEREQAAAASSAQQRQVLEPERERADALAQQLRVARQEVATITGNIGTSTRSIPDVAVMAMLSRPADGVPEALERPVSSEQPSAEVERLLARAATLLRQGDIGGARLFLERAHDMGSAQAGFMLAETFDPLMLSTWRTLGTLGDPARARDLYARAYAGGIAEAKDRANALRQ